MATFTEKKIMHDTAFTALVDQSDAANSDQLRLIDAVVQALGPDPSYRADLTPFALELLRMIAERCVDGRITLCPHLAWNAPQPGVWIPSLPGRLRCQPCHFAAEKRLKMMRENHLCDQCGKHSPGDLWTSSFSRPGEAFDMTEFGAPPAARPPITVIYGLCSVCHADQGQG